ncbi:MAG: hypothetical protein ACRDT4_10970 [Micromonosporaceae bacterium]
MRAWLLVAMLVATGCTAPAANEGCIHVVDENGEKSDKCLPVAASAKRVDTGTPTFSKPTEITNPLHPTAKLTQTLYGGQVDGKPFRTEVTLLPGTKTIEWQGQKIEARISQYAAFSDGRIAEVALDWYAQADDGSVWYLGEDVFNYDNGAVADTGGTWIAGPDAPAAMIMPASPRVGDVYRPENAPEVVFEEVTVTAVGRTVDGPSGPVKGAITVRELHMDGSREDKTFAPGYGEYSTGTPSGDLEQAMLALPTDARPGPVPSELDTFASVIARARDAVAAGDWTAATTAGRAVLRAWSEFQPSDAPLELLRTQLGRDIDALNDAIGARSATAARGAALRVGQGELDLRSRYQPVPATDLARMKLWARQLVVDAAAGDKGGVAGDAECLKWTYDRIGHTADVDAALAKVRDAAAKGDLAAASAAATELLKLLGQRRR